MSTRLLIITAALAAAALALPNTANAADNLVIKAPEADVTMTTGQAYIAARLGGAWADETRFSLNSAAAVPTDIINDYDKPSMVGAIAIGKDFGALVGFGMRGEIEVGAVETEISSHTVTALGATLDDDNAFGSTRIIHALANVAVDYDLGAFKPYATAGIGIANVSFMNHGIVVDAATSAASGLPVGNVTAMNDSANALAWQVGAGVAYALNDTVTLEAGYRYFGVENARLTAVDGTESDVDVHQHQGLFGVRVGF